MVESTAHSVQHECLLGCSDVPAVLRAARGLLGWSQAEFAIVAGIREMPRTLLNFEPGALLERHGIEVDDR